MGKYAILLTAIVIGSFAWASDVITVEFMEWDDLVSWDLQGVSFDSGYQYGASHGSGIDSRGRAYSGGSRYEWEETVWNEWIFVTIMRNDQIVEVRAGFAERSDTQGTLTDLADSATALYADLERQEQLINQTIYDINASITNPESQDKAHTKLTESLIDYKIEYDRIQAEIDATMTDLREEEGSGSINQHTEFIAYPSN